MSMFQSVIDRELGIHRPIYYDSVLSRLVVDYSHSALMPNVERLDFNPVPPIFACKFAEVKSHRHILALANEDGRVAIYDAKKHEPTPLFSDFECHSNAIFDLAWMPNDMKIVTASGDHTAKLWNIGNNGLSLIHGFYNHTRSVRVVVFRPEDCSVFATGGRDGRILIWDTRVSKYALAINKPENIIANGHPIIYPRTPGSSSKKYNRIPDRTNSITGLVFQNDNTLVSCGSGDGCIRVWDLRRTYSSFKKDPLPKHLIPYCGSSCKNGYSNLLYDKFSVKLYANCMDHMIYCYDMGTYNVKPEQIYSGYTASFYIKSSLSPDGKYLISGSNDENAYIWNVKYPEPILKLSGHTAEVTCAVWSQLETTLIATCSDDNVHKIWKIGKESYNHIEILSLLGKAHEILPKKKSHWNILESTPRSSKKILTISERSSSKKSLGKSNNAGPETPNQYKRKPKRNLFEMHNKSLAEITEELPRNCSPKQLRLDLDAVPSTSSTYWGASSEFGLDLKTPTKFLNKSTSPEDKKSPCTFSSPTVDLPNFVLDGRAPHLRNFTPQKRKEVDWLTKLVREKVNHKISKVNNIDDSNGKIEHTKSEKTLLNFFNLIPPTSNVPLTDKTNDPELGRKRKASELSDSVPAKRPNTEIESNESPINKKLQEKLKSFKSLRAYFSSKVNHENKI